MNWRLDMLCRRPGRLHLRRIDFVLMEFDRLTAVWDEPDSMDAAEAFKELWGGMHSYTDEVVVRRAAYEEGLVALPDLGGKLCDAAGLLSGPDLEAWCDWRCVILRSPGEYREAFAVMPEVSPHTGPALLRRPGAHERLVALLFQRRLVKMSEYRDPISRNLRGA